MEEYGGQGSGLWLFTGGWVGLKQINATRVSLRWSLIERRGCGSKDFLSSQRGKEDKPTKA